MRLTKEKAIELTLELWRFLAETGKQKEEWTGWWKYGKVDMHCFLCEYTKSSVCLECPYFQEFGMCAHKGMPYFKWRGVVTPKARKKYAQQIVEQLEQLKGVKTNGIPGKV
ncbi:hypothetical protein LCGC14_2297160 [marine sediment metagenome]|uniref:Uncharacterized protein n=1 Tax=marine sediment metagenome TaxID=412755 RepID=A0A0F9FJQ0_9ZZZZ